MTRQFDAAGAFLEHALAGCHTPIADAARAATADAVRFLDWDKVDAECARLLAAGVANGAIGLNLSNYNDSSTSVWHDKEPAVEFAVYGSTAPSVIANRPGAWTKPRLPIRQPSV